MPIFDVTFQVIVPTLGQRNVTISGVTAADAAQAIATAQANLVQVVSTGVVRTAP